MRSVIAFLIGAGAMVAAYGAFHLAMSEGSPMAAPPELVPAVVVVAGALAAIVDRRPRGLAAVLCGACGVVLLFAGWLRLTGGPGVEWIEPALIGIGLALAMLCAGFVPVALVGWLVERSRHGA